jgi:hypothetical protein
VKGRELGCGTKRWRGSRKVKGKVEKQEEMVGAKATGSWGR